MNRLFRNYSEKEIADLERRYEILFEIHEIETSPIQRFILEIKMDWIQYKLDIDYAKACLKWAFA